MKLTTKLVIILCAFGLTRALRGQSDIRWSLVLERPGKPAIEVCHFNGLPTNKLTFSKLSGDIRVDVAIGHQGNLVTVSAKADSASETACYLSLQANFKDGLPWSYQGEVSGRQVFRQSPHDPGIYDLRALVKQDVPMFAVRDASGFTAAINDTPALYDNYTTQTIDPNAHTAVLSSGDNGEITQALDDNYTTRTLDPEVHPAVISSGNKGPITGKAPLTIQIQRYYHQIGKTQTHQFDAILLRSDAQNLNDLRKDVLFGISRRWGENITGRLGATAFGCNYMLVRSNETGNSRYWVVPGIDYGNKQYSRDSFWQSMVLPAEYARECYQNEAVAQTPGAERPLFCMIWAYRTKLEGGQPDMVAAQKTLQYIEHHTRDGWYYSSSIKGKKNFQSWYDLVAFEDDDVITYNQGLLAAALLSAEALSLKSTVSSTQAIENYQAMFNAKSGYFPLSRQKNLLAVDPLIGDLLAQLYFHRALLSDESVQSQFKQIVAHAKTPYGFKVTCLPDGSYAPLTAYGATDFPVQWNTLGDYQWGASWYLYDMMFLIDCYLHGTPGVQEELIWRGTLDFRLGGTYFETIGTVSGQASRANQGWDGAVYAVWKKLMAQGRANDSLLRAIDRLQPADELQQ